MRNLVKNNVNFELDKNREELIETFKRDLTSNKVMAYFDATKRTVWIVNALPLERAFKNSRRENNIVQKPSAK